MSRKSVKQFSWSNAKTQPAKDADRSFDSYENEPRKKVDKRRSKEKIGNRDIIRAVKDMPKTLASMRELEKTLQIKAPDQRRALKKVVAEMLESGELIQRGKHLMLSKESPQGGRSGQTHEWKSDRKQVDRKPSDRKPSERKQADHKQSQRKRSEQKGGTYTGKLSAHPDGFGFVAVPGREEDLFLPHQEMKTLMHGDTVEVRAVNYRGRESAELVQIIEEAHNVISGQFIIRGGIGMVEARSRKISQAILISKESKNIHDGDWVQVEIQRGSNPLRGRVLQKLGDLLKPSSLIDLIIAEQHLPGDFPDQVMDAANAMPKSVSQHEIKSRKDLRNLCFVTIDGEDAKDFDDAICVLPRGDGFEVWVAIADVAHYVRPNTPLDAEALERSTSFYFPDRVIPMLPEALSNGLCSLKPDVDRLTMVVRMRFDSHGQGRAAHVYDAVIHSHARLTYNQVSAWLQDGDSRAIEHPEARQMISDAARLLHLQERIRAKRGALGLDLPEVRPVVRDDVIQSLEVRERNVAHRLIEELMLSANVAVAKYFESHESALLYRVHPQPEQASIEKVNDFLAPFGSTIVQHARHGVRPLDIQKVLQESEEKPYGHVLHRLILRAMQQAKYSPNNEGHFGLAYDSYCHFTSPIRRYADLTVHRRLKALIQKRDPNRVQPENGLATVGEHVSIQERKQVRSEWDVEAMLGALYHAKDAGKRFKAIVSGITKRRLFVEIEESLAEASIAVDDLGGAFVLDEKNHRLSARRGGMMINLGDELDIEIKSTDPVRGVINIALVAEDKGS